ncbi:MAG: ABC transporter permease [Anaerolineaceae bacterium]|nr:ABC transporter permease [Anaerolineaceae bacterium]
MVLYFFRRTLYAAGLLFVASVVAFVIIQLPPGDYLTTYINNLKASGQEVDQARIENLRRQYGLDQPMVAQYWLWISGFPSGDFGFSFGQNRPVKELVGERLGYSIMLSLLAFAVTYSVAIPIGLYSATHQYSLGDYIFNFIGFIGLAIPGFLLALVALFLFYKYFGVNPGGLFSRDFLNQAWSWAKFWDLCKHLPLPVLVVGLAGTAGTIRVMRASMLDELKKPYVITARAKGLSEMRLLLKYPLRFALNPLASTILYIFPAIISGETITGVVLNLPTIGPLLLRALLQQDMYLAGSLILFLTSMTVIGMFVSEILLAWLDPRIRYE